MPTDIEAWSGKIKRERKYVEDASRARRLSLYEQMGEKFEEAGFSIKDISEEGKDPRWIVYKGEKDEKGKLISISQYSLVNPDEMLDRLTSFDRPEYKGFWDEWKKDSIRSVERLGGMLGSGASHLVDSIAHTPIMRIMPFEPEVDAANRAVQGSIKKWSDILLEDAETWSLQPAKDKNVADFIRRGVIGTMPIMTASAAAMLTTGPAGAFAVSMLYGGEEMRQHALENGASEKEAHLEFMLGGSIYGLIEYAQAGKLFKFARNFDDSAKAMLANSVKEKTLNKMAKKGGQMTYKVARLSLGEGMQEGLQELTEVGIVKMHDEDIDFYDAVERVSSAFTGAAVLAPFLGGPGVLVDRAVSDYKRSEPLDPRTDKIDQTLWEIRTRAANQAIAKLGSEAASVDRVVRKGRAGYEGGLEYLLQEHVKQEGITVKSIKHSEKPVETTAQTAERYKGNLPEGELTSFAEKYKKIEKHFKEPEGVATLLRHVMPKWLVNRTEGIEYVTKDLEAARIATDMYAAQLKGLAQRAMKYYRQKASMGDRFYSWLVNKNTKPIDALFDNLNSHEWAPKDWPVQDQQAFNQLRRLLQGLREVANVGRRKAGLPEIENVRAYITHWYDDMAEHVRKNSYPMHFGYVWRLAKRYAEKPKEWKNSTAFKRQIVDKLKDHYNKNVPELLNAIISYDVRDALLTSPYNAAREELARLQAEGKTPKQVLQDLAQYMIYDIDRESTELDRQVDRALETPTKALNYLLKPFGREIESPARALSQTFRWLGNLGALGFRTKPVLRNLGQIMLLTDLYSYGDVFTARAHQADGFWPHVLDPTTDQAVPLNELLNKQDWYRATERYLSEGADSLRDIIGRAATSLYHKAHMSNVNVSARTGYYDWLRRYQQSQDPNSKYYKHVEKTVRRDLERAAGEAFEKSRSKNKSKFVSDYIQKAFPREMERALVKKSDMIPMIRDAVRQTQWEYLPTSLPLHYRSSSAKAMMMFQSWVQNYYGNHLYEMGHRMMTGRDTSGRVLSPGGRTQAIKGLGLLLGAGRAAEAVLKIEILKFLVLPRGEQPFESPIFTLVSGLWSAAFSKDEYEKKKALREITDIGKLLIPGRYALKDLNEAIDERSLKPLLFYEKEEKQK